MQTVSETLRNAIDSGSPQRVLIVFSDREFTNEDIVLSSGVSLKEEFNSENDITIGLTPSSCVSFALLNDADQLEDFEFGWFTVYLGARISGITLTEITRVYTENGSDATYAFVPLGTFYANKPTVIKKKTINVTAYDRMAYLDVDMPSSETLGITYPTDIGTIAEKICTYYDITPVSIEFLNHALEVEEEPDDFNDVSVRQVIGWIAECACSIARITRDGKLEFAWFNATQEEFDENNYSEFSQAWYETNAINGLYCRNSNNSTDETEGQTKTNNYLIMDNPFLRG